MADVASDPFVRIAMPLLPARLAHWVKHPPLASEWVPEVHQLALLLAAMDAHFDRHGGEKAFFEWIFACSKRLISGPLYRVLFYVVSPERLIRNLGQRWGALRTGTTMSVLSSGPGSAVIELDHPPILYTPLLIETRAWSIRAVLSCTGAKDTRVQIVEARLGRAKFELTWH